MRAYLRIDPELAEQKEEDGYPDGAAWAFVKLLCAGEHQPHRGRFKTDAILRAYMGRHARWVSYLFKHGDLVRLADGTAYIDGWDEWQEGDITVKERVKRIRNRKKLTVDVTVDVTVPTVNTPQITAIADSGKRIVDSNKQVTNTPLLHIALPEVVPFEEQTETKLAIWWQEFNEGHISEHDKQAAAAFVVDYPRLGLIGIQGRITEHADWRRGAGKKPLGKLEFYRTTLNQQEERLADSGVTRPRAEVLS